SLFTTLYLEIAIGRYVRMSEGEHYLPIGPRRGADVIEVGRLLTECRRIVGEDNWLRWLKRQKWDAKLIRQNMNVYEWFVRNTNDAIVGKSNVVFNFGVDFPDLYRLAEPSAPEAARAEVLRRIEEKLDFTDVEKIIRRAQAKARKERKLAVVV